jgi:hypothetical protein
LLSNGKQYLLTPHGVRYRVGVSFVSLTKMMLPCCFTAIKRGTAFFSQKNCFTPGKLRCRSFKNDERSHAEITHSEPIFLHFDSVARPKPLTLPAQPTMWAHRATSRLKIHNVKVNDCEIVCLAP